ncbi:MAG: hypothetical protein ABIJ14_02670 [Nanoarchaeota archaeon]
MADKISGKNIIFYMISIVFFIFMLSIFVIFLGNNYWWILPSSFYLVYFIFRDSYIYRKEFLNRLKVKDRRDIRIDFWG